MPSRQSKWGENWARREDKLGEDSIYIAQKRKDIINTNKYIYCEYMQIHYKYKQIYILQKHANTLKIQTNIFRIQATINVANACKYIVQ